MEKPFRFILSICVIFISVDIVGGNVVDAEIQRDPGNHGIVLGEWRSSDSFGSGDFLRMEDGEDFVPGKILAAKVFLEQPGETITVTLNLEDQKKVVLSSKKTVTDNSQNDLEPRPSVILVELTEIPRYTVTKYAIEIDDGSGKPPVKKTLENPVKPSNLLDHFGRTVSNTAKTLWELPETISDGILGRNRGKPDIPKLHRLVIANIKGETLNTLRQKGELESPLWLPDNDLILFVERNDSIPTLKVVSVSPDGWFERSPGALNFGHPSSIIGSKPNLAPDRKSVVFLQEADIVHADISGTEVTPLIEDEAVEDLVGVFPDSDPAIYYVVFSVRKPDTGSSRLRLAKIKKAKVFSIEPLRYDHHWFLLDLVRIHGKQMLYEQLDEVKEGPDKKLWVWNIYRSASLQEQGVKLTNDEFNDRYPAWSPDGEKIVFVSE